MPLPKKNGIFSNPFVAVVEHKGADGRIEQYRVSRNMEDCCTNNLCNIEKLQARQSKTLKIVLGINMGMFLVEVVAGIIARSTALLADSLDMLGDALVYGYSLYVVSRNDGWKTTSALLKGFIMGLFGLFVLGEGGYKLLYP